MKTLYIIIKQRCQLYKVPRTCTRFRVFCMRYKDTIHLVHFCMRFWLYLYEVLTLRNSYTNYHDNGHCKILAGDLFFNSMTKFRTVVAKLLFLADISVATPCTRFSATVYEETIFRVGNAVIKCNSLINYESQLALLLDFGSG